MITIKKIAEYAGVSIGTVSRALNNDPLIAKKTRKKINDLAQRLDYIPNSLARGLQSKKSFLIGLLFDHVKTSFYSDILQGIGEVAHDNHYGLLTAISQGNPEVEISQLRLFREKSVDAIIVFNYHEQTIPALLKIEQSGIPVILCDIEPYNNTVSVVKVDEDKAYGMIMKHLINLGHKHIAFFQVFNKNSLNRYNLCVKYASKMQVPAPLMCRNKEDLIKCMKAKKATAVIGYSDHHAVQAIQMMRSMGIKIPGRISVTGFDNLDFSSWPEYDITTIHQPKTELGKYAAQMAIQKIKGIKNLPNKIIKPELLIRSSTEKNKNN